MQVDLSGLRALVTGSTKGIGWAIAQKLAQSGAEVAVNGRKAADVENAIERIRKGAPKAKLVSAPGDAATAQGVGAIIGAAGDVDILVNNVGIFEIKNAFEIPDEDWMRIFEVNVLSGVRFARHYGPRMRDRGFGRIIFISSESGVQTSKPVRPRRHEGRAPRQIHLRNEGAGAVFMADAHGIGGIAVGEGRGPYDLVFAARRARAFHGRDAHAQRLPGVRLCSVDPLLAFLRMEAVEGPGLAQQARIACRERDRKLCRAR